MPGPMLAIKHLPLHLSSRVVDPGADSPDPEPILEKSGSVSNLFQKLTDNLCLVWEKDDSFGVHHVELQPLLSPQTLCFTQESSFFALTNPQNSVISTNSCHMATNSLMACARAMHSASMSLRAISVCDLEVQLMMGSVERRVGPECRSPLASPHKTKQSTVPQCLDFPQKRYFHQNQVSLDWIAGLT